MFSELIPISRKKPTQNWWVFHMFSTLGMPTRIADRSLGGSGDAAEGFFANHVRNVGKGIFRFLDSSLDHFHFVQVFDQSLGAGVIHNDALPALGKRNLAPLAPLAPGQLHVDKASLAIHGAPVAHGFLGSGRCIGQFFDRVEAAELAAAATFPPIEGNQGRADRASLPGIGMHYLSLIHISEPTRLGMISYAVFCLKKKN